MSLHKHAGAPYLLSASLHTKHVVGAHDTQELHLGAHPSTSKVIELSKLPEVDYLVIIGVKFRLGSKGYSVLKSPP